MGLPQGPARGDLMDSGTLESEQMIPVALKATLYSPVLKLNHCFKGTVA